jgi:hypothetical protein
VTQDFDRQGLFAWSVEQARTYGVVTNAALYLTFHRVDDIPKFDFPVKLPFWTLQTSYFYRMSKSEPMIADIPDNMQILSMEFSIRMLAKWFGFGRLNTVRQNGIHLAEL